MALSVQTLSDADRRRAADWAAFCAERVLHLFEAEKPDDDRPRRAIARARAFAQGERDIATEIRERFGGGSTARDASPAAHAAARAAGPASAVCHMGAHALGAAAYAVNAMSLAQPDLDDVAEREIARQVAHMSADLRVALRSLPPVGQDRSGPLGPGLLSTGKIGRIIGQLQAAIR